LGNNRKNDKSVVWNLNQLTEFFAFDTTSVSSLNSHIDALCSLLWVVSVIYATKFLDLVALLKKIFFIVRYA